MKNLEIKWGKCKKYSAVYPPNRTYSDLLDYVDKKRLQFTVAVDISYIDKEIQTWLFEYIKENGTVKAVQVAALRTALEVGPMTQAKMISILVNSQPGGSRNRKSYFQRKN